MYIYLQKKTIMKKITILICTLLVLSLYNCNKDENDNSLSQSEVIGTYNVTDTYVFTCPQEGGVYEHTKTYNYQIYVSNGSNLTTSLLAANVNESGNLYEGKIEGNSFSVSNSGCSFSGTKTNNDFDYSISCPHFNFGTYSTDFCDDGTFNPTPIFPQYLVSRTTVITKQ